MNKRGFEFSFAWLFAILAGAVIIFLAIYAATSLIRTERTSVDTETAKQLGILLNPIETNLETSKEAEITFTSETRIYNDCKDSGNFGYQGIKTAVKSGLGQEFQPPGVQSIFYNKYMFSSSIMQGKKLYLFSKPLEMPFKIANLIFAWTDSYCLINPTAEIEDEIKSLTLKNVNITSSIRDCKLADKKVCFSSSPDNCDIIVYPDSKSVKKGNKVVYYEGPLVYGAIFSDPDIYECQVKRLMKRASELSSLYASKTDFLSTKGCSSDLSSSLIAYSNLVRINNSRALNIVKFSADEIRSRNEILSCKLF